LIVTFPGPGTVGDPQLIAITVIPHAHPHFLTVSVTDFETPPPVAVMLTIGRGDRPEEGSKQHYRWKNRSHHVGRSWFGFAETCLESRPGLPRSRAATAGSRRYSLYAGSGLQIRHRVLEFVAFQFRYA
jgi:hypothetical protein